MIDFIGDIHGHADKLEQLLNKLDYSKNDGVYSHPTRKVVFVGDYIDRGPKIRETLQLVKAMVDHEQAIALLGNHEYNAICFYMRHKVGGGHLREHSIKNVKQHVETLLQFQNRQDEYNAYIEWFKTLPLYYETDHFRAVHACWDPAHIDLLRTNLVDDRLTDELLVESVTKGKPLFKAINETLKGKEMAMPEGLYYIDKDGIKRNEIRIKWWENPAATSYKDYSIIAIDNLPEKLIENTFNTYYTPHEKPVFFGHYWLKGRPNLYRSNICCLDYSVAKEGQLVAYCLDDELDLQNEKFVQV